MTAAELLGWALNALVWAFVLGYYLGRWVGRRQGARSAPAGVEAHNAAVRLAATLKVPA